MNEGKIRSILAEYPNRYEICYFQLLYKYLDLKKQIFTNLNQKNILILKNQIIDLIKEINEKLEKNQFILYFNNNLSNTSNKNSDMFIFRPILLLKFWDNSCEDNYLQSYKELNKIFLVKTLIKTKEPIKAFEEMSGVLADEMLFVNSHLFLYYFGKVISQMIQMLDKITDKKILDFLNGTKIDNYNKIKRILREFGQPNSYNYKKRAKNYDNLAKISEFFGIDQKK